MPLSELVEFARRPKRFHFRNSRQTLSAFAAETAQRHRQQNVFRIQTGLVIAADSFEILAAAKGHTRIYAGENYKRHERKVRGHQTKRFSLELHASESCDVAAGIHHPFDFIEGLWMKR